MDSGYQVTRLSESFRGHFLRILGTNHRQCLAVASGLWLGKEGPLVHVACCCANLLAKGFPNINKNEARKREVLSAAAAAGISVAFGSPVGGVLFSLEQLSYYFPDKTMWQSFVCAMVAAVTLQAFNPFRTGKLVLYQVTYHSGWHGFEMMPFALLGILGGLYGGLFIKLNMFVAEWRRSRPIFKGPILEVIVIAVITALINFPIKFMRAQASELVYTLFAECVDLTDDQLGLCKSGRANTGVIALLILAAILGFFLASITFGLQIPAGIILPSIAIGALYGRAVGLILEVWQAAHPGWIIFRNCEPDIPCITPGTYAIVGAASALAGATRMTVSIVVIMFELTGALTYVLPIMIAVMLGKWVGDAIEPKGIYEAWIQFNGYPFLDNRDDDAATVPHVPASQVYTRIEDLVIIEATGHTILTLQELLDEHPYRGFPIINNPRDALLLGYISRAELAFALQSATAAPRTLPPDTEAYFAHQPLADPTTTLDLRPWMDQTPITLNSKASLQLSVNMFMRLGLRYVIFVERGGLKGLLTKKDVWLCLNGPEGVELGDREDRRGHGASEDATGLLGDESPVNERGSREGLG
jgi:chloride channel 3/4/5